MKHTWDNGELRFLTVPELVVMRADVLRVDGHCAFLHAIDEELERTDTPSRRASHKTGQRKDLGHATL